jgi:hypothetical protein
VPEGVMKLRRTQGRLRVGKVLDPARPPRHQGAQRWCSFFHHAERLGESAARAGELKSAPNDVSVNLFQFLF